MSIDLKRDVLRLLEEDEEFRYAVAGKLGILEILKRLDRIEEEQRKIWEEIRSLREGQKELFKGQEKLFKTQEELIKGQRELFRSQERLWRGYERLRSYVKSGFRSLSRTLGVAFEDYAASFVELLLEEMGYPEVEVGRKLIAYKGDVVEINIFAEEPLVVGEATTKVESMEEAEEEVGKLLEKARVVEETLGRKPQLLILSIARASPEVSDKLEELARRNGIGLVLGREIEEALAI